MNNLQQKILAVMDDVKSTVVERDELIHCIFLALLTRRNLFGLGDTGQAKSYAVNEFCKRIIGARKFEKLMSKQADEDQLFGRLDLASIIPGNVSRGILSSDSEYTKMINELGQIAQKCSNLQTPDTFDNLRTAVERTETYRKALAELLGGEPSMVTKGKPTVIFAFWMNCLRHRRVC